MSMKKLIYKLKAFAAKVFRSIERAWERLPDEGKEYVAIAVNVTQGVKHFIEKGSFTCNLVDMMVQFIPTKLDDIAIEKARELIPVLLVKLSLSQSILEIEDDEQRLLAVIERVKLFDNDQKEAFFDAFAKKALQLFSDGVFSWSDANLLVKWYFDNKK